MAEEPRKEASPLAPCVQASCVKCSRLFKALRPSQLCIPSKAVLLIFVWSIVVGAILSSAVFACVLIAFELADMLDNLFIVVLVSYSFLALSLMMFYPLAGFLADVYCGRYRTVVAGLSIICFSGLILSIGTSILFKYYFSDDLPTTQLLVSFSAIALAWFICFAIGLAGYRANIIQLGLDQLITFPSKYLGLFVHWVVWSYYVGIMCMSVLFASLICIPKDDVMRGIVLSLPFFFTALLLILLLFSACCRRWFHSEKRQQNSYKMVLQILNFARKHKRPINRMAETYCDIVRPSRLDYAKERYGGPFTSEQAEDVKAFLRIFGVLICLCFVFILEVPTSYFMYPIFALHAVVGENVTIDTCSGQSVLLGSGSLKYVVVVVFTPLYIFFIYSGTFVRTPKILVRLWCSYLMYVVGALSMLLTYTVGHIIRSRDHSFSSNGACVLSSTITLNYDYTHQGLALHWGVLILPCVLLGMAPMLVTTTAFEFISAQSPHSMKGFLVGIFFATRGLFQFMGSVLLVPFSIEELWNGPRRSAIATCEFGYYLLTIVIAVCGLVLFSVAAKRYKYRRRGELPFRQSDVEDIYLRMIDADLSQESSSFSDTNSIVWSTSQQ